MKSKGPYLLAAASLILIIAFFTTSPGAGRVGALSGNPAPVTPLFTGCSGATVSPVNPGYEQQVVDLVNQERNNNGLPSLLKSDALAQAARYHAADMAQDDYLDHDTNDRAGQNLVWVCFWYDRVKAYYPSYLSLGENVAFGQQTPADVMTGWMNSPDHRGNILNSTYSEIGVGYAVQSGSGRPYWVQDFGDQGNLPALGNIPSNIVFIYSIPEQGLFPASASIQPGNSGSGAGLSWTVSGLPGWLHIDTQQGSTPGSFTLTPTSFDPNIPGDYSGTVTITATNPPGTRNSPEIIKVSLLVVNNPFHWIFLPHIRL